MENELIEARVEISDLAAALRGRQEEIDRLSMRCGRLEAALNAAGRGIAPAVQQAGDERAAFEIAVKALEKLASTPGCGCSFPCRCNGDEWTRTELEGRMDVAETALAATRAALAAQPAQQPGEIAQAHAFLSECCVGETSAGEPAPLIERIKELYSWYYAAMQPEGTRPAQQPLAVPECLISRDAAYADHAEDIAHALAHELEDAELSANDFVTVNREKLLGIAKRILSKVGRSTAAAPAQAPTVPTSTIEASLAEVLHYPACWDTAVYPELADALSAFHGHFGCSECGLAAPKVLPTLKRYSVGQEYVRKAWHKSEMYESGEGEWVRFADVAAPAQAPTAGFPERDQSRPAEQQGLFEKFRVQRLDGSDCGGGKHYGCRYFVLDLDHDQNAPAAMRTYAAECATTHPALSADLCAEFGAAQAPTVPSTLTDEQVSEIIAYQADVNGFDTTTPGGVDMLIHSVARAILATVEGK